MSQTQSSKPTGAPAGQQTGRMVLLALVALSLVFRLGPMFIMGDEWTAKRADSAMYLEVGLSAAAGHGFQLAATSETTAQLAAVMPGYPLLVAAADLTGYGMRALIVFQALAGTATLVLAFLIARRLAGLWAGIVAAALLVFDPLQVISCAALLPSVVLGLALATVVAAGLAALEGLERGSRSAWIWAAVAGAALAGAMYLDPLSGGILLLSGLVAVIARGRRRLLRTWAVALAVLVVALAPWLIRNTILLGRPVLTTDLGARLCDASWPRVEEPQDAADREAIACEAAGRDELSLDCYYMQVAVRRIVEHPLQWFGLVGERVVAIWSPPSASLLWPVMPRLTGYTSLIPVAVLALVGMVVMRRRPGILAWLLLVPVALTLAHAVFGGGPQDRMAVMPILATLGGVGLGTVLGVKGSKV